jgi:membrane-associated protease RseP (regulator of RpoE activity)
MTTFLYILIMILILGVLISLHEAGHLFFAKLFHVYCFDYSIGFGPAFLHVKRKKGETYFSLRVIPLGGYVSMYGEPGVVPDGFATPSSSRSIEGIAKWKKCIILCAGVVVNYLLGLVLILVSTSAFTQYYYGIAYRDSGAEEPSTSLPARDYTPSQAAEALGSAYVPVSFADEYETAFESAKSPDFLSEDYCLFEGTLYYVPATSSTGEKVIKTSNYGPIIDSDITIYNKDGTPYKGLDGNAATYVAVYTPSSGALTSVHGISGDLHLYPAASIDPASVSDLFAKIGVTHFPDVPDPYDYKATNKEFDPSKLDDGDVYFDLDTTLFPLKDGISHFNDSRITVSTRLTVDGKGWSEPGLSLKVVSGRNSAQRAWSQWGEDVSYANVAIIKGIGTLFTTSGWQNASGIVGMTATLTNMNDAATIFYYAGVISINLAFFNLLPFPGLDGWQLLVTIIEAIVNGVKRSRFKKAHSGKRIVDYLPPMKAEEKRKSSQSDRQSSIAAESGVVSYEPIPPSEGKSKDSLAYPVELKEGEVLYVKWRIPAKVKGWFTIVGLSLLFLFAILITVKDVAGLF